MAQARAARHPDPAAQYRRGPALLTSARLRRGGEGGPVGDPEAAEPWQLHPRMTDIEAGDEAEEIELEAFDPPGFDAEQPPGRGFDSRAAVGETDIGGIAKILADRVRRQRDGKLRNRTQDA